ncbi:DUF2207 domain-containing protein [Indiicoccus explosivorum]|uniref:DUF2207 domain-containing protein n=1 Tax=Indiicoccus explosivorum TaxID=1917864 RepID=UPI000B43D990|nr:DUF2207 domain-containing protein [Indiicoccus explosivorum]
MGLKKILPALLLMLLLLPVHAAAVEFRIPEVAIEAQLNEDGSVDVRETHTYAFEGDFNGITREIIPKEGSSITDFTAYENGRPLRTEHEEGIYKVHRQGNDETITVELQYTITDGIEKFEDGAQFYWPFFDERNESDYGDVTITVSPPVPAENPLFVGYDEAYGTGSATEDGEIVFELGDVPEGENGDIRVVYEPELFPAVAAQSGTIRDDLRAEQDRLAEDAAVFIQNQETVKTAGSIVMAAAGLILAGLFASGYFGMRRKKRSAAAHSSKSIVPEQTVSMPATIHFTKIGFPSPNGTAAALLDLVRKRRVKQLTEDRFELISRDTDHPHEAVLIGLLFDKIGDGRFFALADLEAYTKNELNHGSYSGEIAEWNRLVDEEVKLHGFTEQKSGLRWMAVVLGLVFSVMIGVFGWYELLPFLFFSLLLAGAAFAYAVFYKPLTVDGHAVRQQWRQLEETLDSLTPDQLKQLPADDKLRGFLYVIGIGGGTGGKQAKSFMAAGNRLDLNGIDPIYYTPFLVTAFVTANTSTASAAGGSAISGGGVGGGGGGSGAF